MAVFSAVPRNAWDGLQLPLSSPDWELGNAGGDGLIAEPQVPAGLCSHSCDGGDAVGTSSVSASSVGKGWQRCCCLHPWLSRSQAGENSAVPGAPCGAVPSVWELCCPRSSMSCCTFSVLGCTGVSSSPQHSTVSQEHQVPDVVADPEPVKRSLWPPHPGRAAPGLNIHGHKAGAVTTSSPTDSSFLHILRKCSVPHHLSDVLLLSCSHPSFFKEQTSSLLKWLKLLTRVPWGCWQKPRVYQHSQTLNSAGNFLLQALRHRERRDHLDVAQ